MRHATPRHSVYYGWLIVATTFWMAMLTGGGRSGFGVFVIPMSEELGWNRGTISLAAALGALISGFSQPFVGRLYDRLGGRRLILISLVVSGLSTALLALTHHLVSHPRLWCGPVHRPGRVFAEHHLSPALQVVSPPAGDGDGVHDDWQFCGGAAPGALDGLSY